MSVYIFKLNDMRENIKNTKVTLGGFPIDI